MSAHRTFVRLGAALALTSTVVLSACGSDPAEAAPDPSTLNDKTYVSTAASNAGIPGGGPLEVTFSPGRISATAGCNRHNGTVAFDGDVLTAGPLAATMMACPGARGAADGWLSSFFEAPVTWSSSGDRLTLSRDGRTVELAERVNTALTGTEWTVESLVRASGIESSVVLERVTPRLRIGGDGRVTGFTGCNDLTGTAKVTGDRIEFTSVSATEKTCDDEVNRIEKTVLDTLRGAATYRIDGRTLALTNVADPAVGLRLRTS
ncbi:MAG: META domain-containing protein [Gordonia sp. (in: high G+C Gram-positive bacteria)]|uniref:META domain-containing protein n=1 Tax=Gordonia sp. (in: high G+C Gram-positive bacteria) TaxID=84139 RepID=UPI0039E4EE81